MTCHVSISGRGNFSRPGVTTYRRAGEQRKSTGEGGRRGGRRGLGVRVRGGGGHGGTVEEGTEGGNGRGQGMVVLRWRERGKGFNSLEGGGGGRPNPLSVVTSLSQRIKKHLGGPDTQLTFSEKASVPSLYKK